VGSHLRRSSWRILILVVLATVLVVGAVDRGAHGKTSISQSESHFVNVVLASQRVAGASKLIDSCSRQAQNISLGLKSATIEKREGSDLALLFANRSQYSMCLEESTAVSASHPVAITRHSESVYELESMGDLNKVKGKGMYATNQWFVVGVQPTVVALKVVTDGRSEVTSIHNGFALVHESETVNLGAKSFSYGVVVAFNADGAFIGSAALT
jgi:hypothetical protein